MTIDGSLPGSRPDQLSMDESVGQLVSQLTTDLGQLTRQELALAKAELQAEAKKAGKGAGMLGGATLAGWMVALFLSFTVMWALDEAMDLIWAALIVAALWAVVAAVLATKGRKELQDVNPKPDQTVESLKEDAKWLTRKS
ncbi:putative superfamily III holin-X [Kribbella orskensis]|uniref:Superfamily III holin-X n=1 Tax=Kribbella orskensis TaxID=2512216 RepID=A0ABY2BWG7_9ACTN|nr:MULTISPECIES: phage holin family protein [Kribbella]TCN44764.1 putative superfamily III holin-X [Kribbella sp. VKM Ac-2500]TCO31458.1 putative superfamily III holin-X [Kribbella orskensis]